MIRNPDPKPKNKNDVTDENYVPKVHWFSKIPYPVKAIVLKFWFFGMEFYFFQMGLGYFFQDPNAAVILMLIFGFAMGVFNEIFVYPLLDVVENKPGQSKPYVLIKSKKLYSLFANVLFGLLIGCGASLINALIRTHLIAEADLGSYGFAEPVLVACYALVLDAFLVLLKDLAITVYHRVIKKEGKEEWSYVL